MTIPDSCNRKKKFRAWTGNYTPFQEFGYKYYFQFIKIIFF